MTDQEQADKAYNKAVKEHEEMMLAEEKRAYDELDKALPESTRKILAKTMTLDKYGPKLPRRDQIYRKYGIS